MLARSDIAPTIASGDPVGSDSDKSSTVGSDSDDGEWFYDAACSLLGKDAGYALSYVTGFPEGSCYKYCAHDPSGRRKPPAYLFRALLRSDQGWQWLCTAMDGSEAAWWIELQRARKIADALDNVK